MCHLKALTIYIRLFSCVILTLMNVQARKPYLIIIGLILIVGGIVMLFLMPPHRTWLVVIFPPSFLLFFALPAIGTILIWKGFNAPLPKLKKNISSSSLVFLALAALAVLLIFFYIGSSFSS